MTEICIDKEKNNEVSDYHMKDSIQNSNQIGSSAQLGQESTQKKPQKRRSTLLNSLKSLRNSITIKLNTIGQKNIKDKIKKRKRQEITNSSYDPDAIPPDFHKADDHRVFFTLTKLLQLANIVGKNLQEDELSDEEIEFCECCTRQIQKKYFDLLCDNKDFSFLGSGYTLFFEYLKQCQIILIQIFLISGLFNFVTNLFYGDNCLPQDQIKQKEADKQINQDNSQSNYCQQNWITTSSVGNKLDQYELIEIQQILDLVSIIIIIITLQLFRKKQRIMDQECDVIDISPQDYTIYVSNIPTDYEAINENYNDDLLDFLAKNALQDQICQISSINLCYNLNQLEDIESEKKKILEKKKEIMRFYHQFQKYIKGKDQKYINMKLNRIKNKKSDIQKKFYDGQGREFMKKFFIGKALVQFQKQEDVVKIIKKYKEPSIYAKLLQRRKNEELIYHGNKLKIKPAPAPKDVLWHNLHVKKSSQYIRMTIGYIFQLILLFCSILITLQIANYQAEMVDSSETIMSLLALSLSGFIALSNVFFMEYSNILVSNFKLQRRTYFNIDVAKNISLVLFVNTALLPFVLKVILRQDQGIIQKIFGGGGLVYNQYFVFLTQAFITPLIYFIDHEKIINNLQRAYYRRQGEKCVLSQFELNQIWEKPDFNISELYAICLNIMFLTAFYMPLIPTCIGWGIIALSIQYIVNKYNFLRQKSCKFYIGGELGCEMIEQLEFFLPIFSFSNFMFYLLLQNELNTLPLLGFIIGVLHATLPMHEINRYFFKTPPMEENEQDLDQVIDGFDSNYKSENPATADYERQRRIKNLTKKSRVSFNKNLLCTNIQLSILQFNQQQESINQQQQNEQISEDSEQEQDSSQDQKSQKNSQKIQDIQLMNSSKYLQSKSEIKSDQILSSVYSFSHSNFQNESYNKLQPTSDLQNTFNIYEKDLINSRNFREELNINQHKHIDDKYDFQNPFEIENPQLLNLSSISPTKSQKENRQQTILEQFTLESVNSTFNNEYIPKNIEQPEQKQQNIIQQNNLSLDLESKQSITIKKIIDANKSQKFNEPDQSSSHNQYNTNFSNTEE